ncbi:transcriptional regulator [Brachybacterium avium]|uniref:Transcriptional regulator n=1 Tax=Brachybacterium avium TaxID=2017485 RepID=A0A220UGQ9_9MICO|nr:helix-turn-helix transcriptional regulator [Brachybacterium avium]ASK67096.1 transcriptional regulator [Brachybacterium avium]
MRNDLKARRAERRWSQAELGTALGVSRQTVIALENDKYDPSLPLAFRIAALFECPIEEIFTPDEEGPAAP